MAVGFSELVTEINTIDDLIQVSFVRTNCDFAFAGLPFFLVIFVAMGHRYHSEEYPRNERNRGQTTTSSRAL